MYARQHVNTHIVLFVILVGAVITWSPNEPLGHYFGLNSSEEFIFTVLGTLVYLLGALLPDSDSHNKGSTIFYTIFSPIAYLVNYLERPIANFLKRKKEHRGVLHSTEGILISSVIAMFLFYLVGLVTFKAFMSLKLFLALYEILIISQVLHVFEDGMIPSRLWLLIVPVTLYLIFS